MSDMQEREKLISEMLGVSNLPSPTDPAPFLSEDDDEVIELNEDFDFDGFQVVRREFFSHLREPSVTFNNHKFYVNMACIAKFPTAEYVQVLINQETKIMDMPKYDPDAEISSLTLTIPSWKSSIERTRTNAILSTVSSEARKKVTGALEALITAAAEMIAAIEEEKWKT